MSLSSDLTPDRLAQLAEDRPDLWPDIWQYPNCPERLREWMATQHWSVTGEDPASAVAVEPRARMSGRRLAMIVVAVLVIVALAFGAGVAALSLTGSLDSWVEGGHPAVVSVLAGSDHQSTVSP